MQEQAQMKQAFDRIVTLKGTGGTSATGETGVGVGGTSATGACLASHASRHAIVKVADS